MRERRAAKRARTRSAQLLGSAQLLSSAQLLGSAASGEQTASGLPFKVERMAAASPLGNVLDPELLELVRSVAALVA
jgi:hypothetical protein